MADLLVIETKNGGDLRRKGNDLAMVTGLENQPYLSMFGGGDNQWWGNGLLLSDIPTAQFFSETEHVLNNVALNSAGRIKIEQAVQNDLAYLKEFYPGLTITVTARILSDDKVEIGINLNSAALEDVWSSIDLTDFDIVTDNGIFNFVFGDEFN